MAPVTLNLGVLGMTNYYTVNPVAGQVTAITGMRVAADPNTNKLPNSLQRMAKAGPRDPSIFPLGATEYAATFNSHFGTNLRQMTPDTQTTPTCPICGKPCPQADCVKDAKGNYLHKQCYRDSLIQGRGSL